MNSVPPKIWQKIADWGRMSNQLESQKITTAHNLSLIVAKKLKIDDKTREIGISILNQLIKYAPQIIEEIYQENTNQTIIKLTSQIIKWNVQNQKLTDDEHQFMTEIVDGKRGLSDVNKNIVVNCLNRAKENGFGQ